MATDPWTPDRAHETLMTWAAAVARLRVMDCPSVGQVKKYLDLKDSAAIGEYVRAHIRGLRPDTDMIEVRVPCWTWRQRPFRKVTVADWVTDNTPCRCRYCDGQPTLSEAAPHLANRLVDQDLDDWPADPTRIPVTAVRRFLCPNASSQRARGHDTVEATAQWLLDGAVVCKQCWSTQGKRAGQIVEDRATTTPRVAVTPRETAIIAELTNLVATPVLTDRRIVLRASTRSPIRAIKPDAVIPDHKVAIEIDGGNGVSPHYSFHDTPAGQASDEERDRSLADVGWSVIRVRHPNALPLDTHARILTCPPHLSAAAVARRIADAFTDVVTFNSGTHSSQRRSGGQGREASDPALRAGLTKAQL